jgi:DNA-binding GntR family transcriptional regulator
MDDGEIAGLRRLHEASLSVVESEDLTGWQQANLAFHEHVYRGARNPFLRQEVLRIRSRTGAYRRHAYAALGRLRNSYEQHEAIVNAIEARDAAATTARMVEHMQPGRDARSLNDFVVKLPAELLASA